MTRIQLEELNKIWNELNSIAPVVGLLSKIEEGGTIYTDKDTAQISQELVKRFTIVARDYYRELCEKFEEM